VKLSQLKTKGIVGCSLSLNKDKFTDMPELKKISALTTMSHAHYLWLGKEKSTSARKCSLCAQPCTPQSVSQSFPCSCFAN